MKTIPLAVEHRKMAGAFSPVERSTKSNPRRRVFQELADAIAIHMALEGRLVGPPAKARAARERERVALRKGKEFRASAAVLREILAGDVPEQSAQLFLDVARIMGEEALASLGGGLTIRAPGSARSRRPLASTGFEYR
jgi:hypothetical protein